METLELTTKKFGNSVGIVLSKQLEVQAGMTYLVHKSKDGAITLSPKISNPFLNKMPETDNEEDLFFEKMGAKEFNEEL